MRVTAKLWYLGLLGLVNFRIEKRCCKSMETKGYNLFKLPMTAYGKTLKPSDILDDDPGPFRMGV
jgi:hypothetical protein